MPKLPEPITIDHHVDIQELRKAAAANGLRQPEEASAVQVRLHPTRSGRHAGNDPFLAGLPADLSGEVGALVEELYEHQDKMFTWMHQSEENARKFLTDPLAAFQEATSSSGALLEKIKTMQTRVMSALEKGGE